MVSEFFPESALVLVESISNFRVFHRTTTSMGKITEKTVENFSVLIFYISSLNFIVKNSNIKLLLRHKGNENFSLLVVFGQRESSHEKYYTFAI